MTKHDEEDDLRPSKEEKKREMQALRDMAEQLAMLSKEQLSTLDMPEVILSIEQAKRITKGNARKRQIGHITKLLSRSDTAQAKALLDELDASSVAHVQKFHQLETWRERLLHSDAEVMAEILSVYPDLDRQHLRQLVRAAIKEADTENKHNYKKLFQFLKSLSA